MTAINNVWALVRKEWRHYFGSPIAYVALFVWAVLFGVFFFFAFNMFLERSMMTAQMEFGAPKMSLNEWVIRPLFSNMAVVALFVMPMLTMRLFAEEKRQGTIELLATAPLTDLQIVVGKFLSAVGLFALMVVSGLANLLLIWYYASPKPEWKPVLTGALGMLLLGACFIAIGMLISTLTDNQLVAGALSFCAFLGMLVMGWAESAGTASFLAKAVAALGLGAIVFIVTRHPVAAFTTTVGVTVLGLALASLPGASGLEQMVAELGVIKHMDEMVKGVLSLKDVVFYLCFITFGLFLTHQSLESQRWRA